ncbi:hypothetical protein H9W84_05995 [Moraxella sp. PS-22]|uniref:FHA domain-containing protein n=1 Tax=Moraxella tetraodonis TaxID=2767221 RepID=A0A9X1URG1_9GAMM|nr:hypothetical protein [Moraxella tetraodonis]MCG8147681.1 hypothetical protein [Moraxella tetraodonis]
MAYITTNHRFIIDDKHPSDVFDEMENFFSLYTTAIDDLQRVSVQLSVPTSFDITANKKMAESYRHFTQSLKYTMPDIHILPIKTHAAQTADDDDTASEADNSVILLIQRLDGYALDDEDENPGLYPSLYRSVLGRLIPRFAEEKSATGHYPERAPITLPEPIAQPAPLAPIPVSPQYPTQPVSPPPQPAQAYQMPVQSTTPPSTPNPVPTVAPMQPPLVNTESMSSVSSKPQPTRVQPPTAAPKPMVTLLPNIQKSAKPYQDLLTDAIMAAAKQWVDKSQVITQITLKSNDGLTTAMVEQLFSSFNHAHESTHTQHDAIDLVSYGYEVLKPKLATIGVTLSDEAQFGLKAKVQATPTDIARLQKGEVFSNEIKLGVKFMTQAQNQNQAQPNSNHHIPASPPAFSAASTAPRQAQSKLPQLNQNLQQIVLTIKSVDGLGERQQKVREFPIIFASREAQIAHALRLFAANDLKLASGVYFAIVESQGQLLIDEIDPNISITRNGQPINRHDVLLPNDVLSINHAITVQLLLAH